MNVKVFALIAAAAWAPIATGAARAPEAEGTVRGMAVKCKNQDQILDGLRRQGYRVERRSLKRTRSGYEVKARRGSRQVVISADRCTGKLLGVQDAARAKTAIKTQNLKRPPLTPVKCLSKSAVYQKLKSGGYGYLKPENVWGPFNTPKGKVFRAQTLMKLGPQWCQQKLVVNCHTGKVTKSETLQQTCIY